LEEEVRRGRFRKDLYFRLAVTRLKVPPLRDRDLDLPRLAERIANELGARIPDEAMAAMAAYEWPGNGRELRNVVTQLAVHPRAQVLPDFAGSLLETRSSLRPLPEARRLATDAFEQRYVERALLRADGNLTRAADLAGVSLRALQYLAHKHGIRVRDRS
jgi:DNA-binding NtrC family response regulator